MYEHISKIIILSISLINFSCVSFYERNEMKEISVKNILADALEEKNFPSLQYLVASEDSILFEFSGGFADLKNKIAASSNTRYKYYSITKTFTAAAILLLAQRNQITLDEPAIDYLPFIPYGRSVKIKHLLSHTSGIPNPIPLKWVHLTSVGWTKEKEDSLLKNILNENSELDFKPGTKYQYSNIGYWLLGKIIEQVSGVHYSKFVEENILHPLSISRDELDFSDEGIAKGYLAKWSFMNLIKSFLIDDELIGEYENNWLNFNSHQVDGIAYGGINGTARGAAKFLQDQLKDKSLLFDDSIRKYFFEEIMINDSCKIPMTLAWHIGSLDGRKYFFKEGGGGGFHSEMRIYPEEKFATIIAANKTSSEVIKLLNQIDIQFLQSIEREKKNAYNDN